MVCVILVQDKHTPQSQHGSKGEYFLYVNGKKSKEIEHKKEKIDIYEYIKDKDRIYGMVLTYDRKVIEDNIKKKKEQCKEFKFK